MTQFITLHVASFKAQSDNPEDSLPPRYVSIPVGSIISVGCKTTQKHTCVVTYNRWEGSNANLYHSLKVLESLPSVVARLNAALLPAPETIIHKDGSPTLLGWQPDYGQPVAHGGGSGGRVVASGEVAPDNPMSYANSVT